MKRLPDHRPPARARTHSARLRHRFGFTLLELAITLAVMAILATLAVPDSAARIERGRLEATAQSLVADLSSARLEAAERGLPLHLQLRPGSDWCWAVSLQSGCDCGTAAACQVRRVDGGRTSRLQLLDAAPSVRLDPQGQSSASTVATLQSLHGDRLRVSMTPLGRAHLCVEASTPPDSYRLPRC